VSPGHSVVISVLELTMYVGLGVHAFERLVRRKGITWIAKARETRGYYLSRESTCGTRARGGGGGDPCMQYHHITSLSVWLLHILVFHTL